MTRLHQAGRGGRATLTGLAAYSASRPPHSEGLAVTIASYLAHETGLPNINLLHLSSRKAIEAAMLMAGDVPAHRLPPRGHRSATCSPTSTPRTASAARSTRRCGRARTSRRCGSTCSTATSTGSSATTPAAGTRRSSATRATTSSLAKSGFGGAEYLLPGLVSEGRKRGLSLPADRRADLAGTRRGATACAPRATIAVGFDADFCLVDPDASWTVRAADSESTQEYTPFEGFELTARVTDTFVRGHHVLRAGKVVGAPVGAYLHRPTGTA